MKKRVLIALLAVTASVSCAFGLAACGEDEKKDNKTENGWGTEYSVQTAYQVATELGYKGTLEEFIESISGKDGENGTNGKDGNDGVDGRGIDKVEVNAEGEIVLTFTDETSKNVGALPDCKHSYSDWAVGLAPTCTSIGYHLRTCTKCGDKDYKIIEQTEHTWDDGVVLIKPTSKLTGLELFSCTTCRTAKTEVLDVLEVLTAEEWKAAIHATLMSDNFSYEWNSVAPNDSEPVWYEKVAINLDEGLSYYYTDRADMEGNFNYKEEVYYKLDQEDKISFNNTSVTYKDKPNENEIYGWVVAATISDYTRSYYQGHPEKVKFGLDNHGYSMLESLEYWLTDEMWGKEGLKLEDAYDCFEFNGETQSYVYTDEDGMVYSFKFDDGYISEFSMQYDTDGFVNHAKLIFFDYETTKVTIPQELVEIATEKGLTYEYWYGLEEETELIIKPQYFGYIVTSINKGAFSGGRGLVKITIPETVTKICKYAFSGCRNLKDIYFEGTKEQWNAIEKGENWDNGTGMNWDSSIGEYIGGYTVHCSDGDIVKE